ncbi:MAG: hypothetical protein EOO61_04770 [Hymenobacter sp.]|nr:MAG: hypothetical protein EOO61_04770 [Hymenobacter sp.]
MKQTPSTRTRKQSIFFALIIFVTAILILGFSKRTGYASDGNISSVRHYIDKGICPGIGISNVKLKTKFADDKLLYIINLTVDKNKKRALPHSFTVKLVDKDSFDVQSFTVDSSFFTEELDASENLVSYSYQSIQIMDADKYQLITGWNLIWTFN